MRSSDGKERKGNGFGGAGLDGRCSGRSGVSSVREEMESLLTSSSVSASEA